MTTIDRSLASSLSPEIELVHESSPIPETSGTAGPSAAEDARLVEEAVGLFAALATDPTAILELTQSWLRDITSDAREDSARTANERSAIEMAARELAREAERAARASAKESADISNVFGWIAVGLAAIGGVVGAAFTGGVSLGLAIAAAVLMVGAQTMNQLGSEGVMDGEAASYTALGLSIAGTICSFGASAAGAVPTTIDTAVKVANISLSVATAVAQAGGGISDLVGTQFTYDADLREIDGESHRIGRDEARSVAEENATALAATMRSFRRMAERRAEAREAHHEGMRVAINALRG